MQPPIKFRFWHKVLKRWLVPAAADLSANGSFYTLRFGSKTFKANELDISRYTGYKDIYGKEIYEGDLLNTVGNAEAVDSMPVVWEFGGFWIDGSTMYDYAFGETDKLEDLAIVGNIYEELHNEG